MNSSPVTPADAHARAAAAATRGVRVILIGTLASAALAAVKILGGVLGNSYALIADGIESLLDILSSLVVWGGLKVAAKKANERFPYGYGRAEPLAGLTVAVALLIAAAGLAIQSVRQILHPAETPALFTLLIIVVVVAVKELMFRILSRTGKAIDSQAVQNDAWHHRSDALTSIAAFIGIAIAHWGGPGYESADAWAALLACGLIAFNGLRIFRSAVREVLDAAAPTELLDQIRAAAKSVPNVCEIDDCRARKSGLGWLVDIHVEVDGDISVSAGHRIAHQVKDALLTADLAVLDALVHIEPARVGSADSSGDADCSV